MREEFKKELNQKAALAEASLEQAFETRFDAPDIIVSAVKYSLFAGGKRLRPVLMTETARAFGGDPELVRPLADAIEMIHTYSLIHDDLPAMDDDDTRRGKPTNHIVYGEDTAILAGDALLNLAMERALEGVPNDNPQNYLQAMRALFYSSGINGMIGGQTADTITEAATITEEDIDYIHTHKTGALLKAAVLCGAIPVIGQDTVRLGALGAYAEAIGMAFQIVDDILDVEGDEKKLGKPIGSDEKNHKATFVALYGMASAVDKVEELRGQAHEALEGLDGDMRFLQDMADYVCLRKN